MVLWPAGLAVVIVWQVFRDTAMDYRLVMAGAVLPDLVDAPFGGARVSHTLVASVSLLTLVMLVTRGHRHARRRWLAVPIGTFVHLLVDGMWTKTATFWWPLFGTALDEALPALESSAAALAAKELAGTVALVWFYWRFRLDDRAVRAGFLRTGRLRRDRGR